MAKKAKIQNKEIKQYIELPYSFTVGRDTDAEGEEYYYALVNELPGCVSDGKSAEEALANIQDAMYDWIETALVNGDKVPSPESYSGKFTVRIPPSLHKDLVARVNKEGVSINQFVSNAIARAVGFIF